MSPSGGSDDDEVADDGGPVGPSNVVPWKAADIHKAESSDSFVVGQPKAGRSYAATCWVLGERVQSDGYATDHWVEVDDGAVVGFVNGVFLRGNESGVTRQCP